MSADCCDDTLDVTGLERRQRRTLYAVLALNVATFAMMLVAALKSGSSALYTGALDNLGDAATYIASLAVVGKTPVAKARVAFLKGLLILGTALAVAVQVAWRLTDPVVPVFETMSIAAALNLGANLLCLTLLTPHRHSDTNMASVWECSRNDVADGLAVIAAALGVWYFGAGWPDLLVAVVLLILFFRSAIRVLRSAWNELAPPTAGRNA